ncbi:MAG: 16S rRNA (guanine(527)-N(7))-methyltransferase RsmG [Terriglobales bacterium]
MESSKKQGGPNLIYNPTFTIRKMDPVQIAEALRPFVAGLSGDQLSGISTYLDMLLRWNARTNLTAIRDTETMVTRHFGESLFAAKTLFPNATENSHVIDVGSGAGFPGLPMKVWAPNIQLTLIESNYKKATFLREVVRALELDRIEVFTGRAEAYAGTANAVTLRAVERFETVLQTAAKLVQPKGVICLLITASQYETATSRPGFSWQDPIALPQSESRILLVGTSNQELKEPK